MTMRFSAMSLSSYRTEVNYASDTLSMIEPREDGASRRTPDDWKLVAIQGIAVAQAMQVVRLRWRGSVMQVADPVASVPERDGSPRPVIAVVRPGSMDQVRVMHDDVAGIRGVRDDVVLVFVAFDIWQLHVAFLLRAVLVRRKAPALAGEVVGLEERPPEVRPTNIAHGSRIRGDDVGRHPHRAHLFAAQVIVGLISMEGRIFPRSRLLHQRLI